MPIEPKKALGAKLGEGSYSWTKDQVILYHLGVGAGDPATDPRELEYTYEKNLKVLPSFGVIPVFGAMGGLGTTPGLSFNFAMLLHGEQDIEVHQPIPPEATVTSAGEVVGVNSRFHQFRNFVFIDDIAGDVSEIMEDFMEDFSAPFEAFFFCSLGVVLKLAVTLFLSGGVNEKPDEGTYNEEDEEAHMGIRFRPRKA